MVTSLWLRRMRNGSENLGVENAGSMGSCVRYGKFAGTEVLGTEFKDTVGIRGWVFAFWSERDPRVRICFASRGELPEHITLSDRENLQSAKIAWEACPGTMPN
jgi:hypothetical protein